MKSRQRQKFSLSIGDVARRTGLTTSALRFYEEKALIESLRTPGNQRCYARDVIHMHLVSSEPSSGSASRWRRFELCSTPCQRDRERLAPATIGTSSRGDRKPWLDERIAALERLRDQLSSCIGCGCLSLDRCALYNPDDAAGSLGTGPRYLLGDSPGDLRLQR